MSAFAAIRNLPWTPPTKAVPAPVALLAAAKEAGVDLPAEFVVRMPTVADAAFVNEAESRAQNMAAMLETFAANGLQDKADALKAAAGLDGSPPKSFGRQVEYVLTCLVEPALDREDALWVSRMFPVFFSEMFLAVMNLSGEGATLGKPPSSTETPPSSPP